MVPEVRVTESMSPTTTEQEDKVVEGQRRINLIWEVTQAVIAILVVLFTMVVSAYLVIYSKSEALPTIFSVAFGMVTGFYFARTNHQNIGGTGKKANEDQEYQGR